MTKIGTEIPIIATPDTTRSISVFFFSAAMSPALTPAINASNMAIAPSHIDNGSATPISSATV